jgi:hypothetical protein
MRTAAIIAAILTCALGGCADPYATHHEPRTGVAGEAPQRLRLEPKSGTARTPMAAADAAIRRAVALTTTWNAGNAAQRMRRFADMTTGQARRDALNAAARLTTDPLLRRGAARSRGDVLGVALERRDPAIRLVVVRSRLIVQGIRQDHIRVVLATLHRSPRGWSISHWEPQP